MEKTTTHMRSLWWGGGEAVQRTGERFSKTRNPAGSLGDQEQAPVLGPQRGPQLSPGVQTMMAVGNLLSCLF